MNEASGAGAARSDALRRVRYQLGRCEDAIDLAHMTLIEVGKVEAEWSREYKLDLDVLRSKLGSLASFLSSALEPSADDPRS